MINILVLCCCVVVVFGDLSLLLLHTNDMHARFEPVNRHMGRCDVIDTGFCYGGFARLHAMVKHFKTRAEAEGRFSLFVNAGDTFQGTPYYSVYKWKLAAKMVNLLDIDVMTLGNHEFDDGLDSLVSFVGNLTPTVVCSNLDLSHPPSIQRSDIVSSKVLEINGTKVGIVGYLTPRTLKFRDLDTMNILDEISSIEKETQKLREEGVQIVIALGHSGYDFDLELAKKVRDVDVVVGGHTHTFLYSGKKIPEIEEPVGVYPTVVKQESGKQVPVVQAYYGTKYLGYLELDFDDQGNLIKFNGSPVLLLGVYPEDQTVLNELQPYKEELDKMINRIVGYTHTFLDNNNFKCKMGECEIGNLIADSYTNYMFKHCPLKAIPIGLMNAGGVRSSLDVTSAGQNGSITLGDIMTAIPWEKPILALNVPGIELLKILEHAIFEFDEVKTSHIEDFLQVSGLRVTYDLSKTVGSQVTEVKVLCSTCTVPTFEPLNLEDNYTVVVPQHLAVVLADIGLVVNLTVECTSKDVDYMIIAEYIETYSPVNPRIEGRIKISHGEISYGIILIMFWYLPVLLLIIFILKDYILKHVFCLRGKMSDKGLSKNYQYSKLPSDN